MAPLVPAAAWSSGTCIHAMHRPLQHVLQGSWPRTGPTLRMAALTPWAVEEATAGTRSSAQGQSGSCLFKYTGPSFCCAAAYNHL